MRLRLRRERFVVGLRGLALLRGWPFESAAEADEQLAAIRSAVAADGDASGDPVVEADELDVGEADELDVGEADELDVGEAYASWYEGFGSGPERPEWGRPRDEFDFLVFLSLRDRWAFDRPGVGLWEGLDRWAAAKGEAILFAGDGALVDELEILHRDWQESNAPKIEDWHLRFIAPGDADAPTGALEVRRAFFRELAWV